MAVAEVQQLQSRLDALEERMFGAPAGAASAGGTRKVSAGAGGEGGRLLHRGVQVSQNPSSPGSRCLSSAGPWSVL